LDESFIGVVAEAVLVRRGAVVPGALKAGRKSGGVGSIQLNPVEKKKCCAFESINDGRRTED